MFNKSKTVFILFYVNDYFIIFVKEHYKAIEVII